MSDSTDSKEKSIRTAKVAFTATLLLLGVSLYLFLASRDIGLVSCVIRRFTGLRCPGCGLTHAALDLLRLDFGSAFHHNALFPLISLYAAAALYAAASSYIRTGRSIAGTGNERIDMAFLILLLGWFVIRNILSI